MKFKTNQANGVIFYTKSYQNNDYYLVELINGTIHVGIDLGSTIDLNGEMSIECSSFLDDYQWHDLEIRHDFNSIRITIDQIVCRAKNHGHFACLNIDSKIYVGGVLNHFDRGIKVHSNFYGCIEDMVIVLLDENMHKIDIFNGIRDNIVYYGIENGEYLSYYCPTIDSSSSFTFLNSNSFIGYDFSQVISNELNIKLDFRTFEKDCLIFIHFFSTQSKKFPVNYNDYLSVYLQEEKLTFELNYKSKKISFQHLINAKLNDGRWHSVNLYFTNNFLNFTIDYTPEIAKFNFKFLELGNKFYFGGLENGYSVPFFRVPNFIGCMKNIRINTIDLTSSNLNLYNNIEFNTCKINDRCSPNPCENGGICQQNSFTFTCDCTNTGYGGSICHTPSNYLSCLDYKYSKIIINDKNFLTLNQNDLNNLIDSNHQWYEEKDLLIDIDGSGPLRPIQVTCKFGTATDMVNTTIVKHLIEPNTIVPTGYSQPGSYSQKIVYNAELVQIRELIKRAYYCSQYIEYRCLGSRLLDGPFGEPFGYWTSIDNQKMDFWGEAELGTKRCGCSIRKGQTCLNPNKYCNCDAGDFNHENIDAGYIVRKEYLPILKVNFGDTGFDFEKNRLKTAKYTIGPLSCEGDNLFNNEITFRKSDSGLILNKNEFYYGEENEEKTSFDLRFEFKTAHPIGIFIHSVNKYNGDFIEIRLQSKNEINFRYNFGRGTQVISIITPYDLTDLNWHKVQIERNCKESIMNIDMFSRSNQEDLEYFRPFYINDKIAIGSSLLYKDGFVGCMRALLINGVFIDLISWAKKGIYGVGVGCVGKCESKPCLNNGKCLEYYDSFKCDCTFTPFRGPVCSTEIGVHLEPDNYIKYTIPNIGLVASENEIIQAAFSSYLKTGIIMQILSDPKDKKGRNEYFSIELNNNGGLRVKFNFGFDSFEYNSPMYLANGQMHSVRVVRDNNGRRLNISIDSYKPVIYHFDKTSDFDLIFDSPRYIYIGRNESMPDDSGMMGCLSRLQYNRIFPLKLTFLEIRDPNIKINGKNIRDRMCDIDPVSNQIESIEKPPDRDIKILHFSHYYISDNLYFFNYLNSKMKLLAFVLIILCIIFYMLLYNVYNNLFLRNQFYLIKTDWSDLERFSD